MSAIQAFLLGMMVAWTPSLVLLAWFLSRGAAPAVQDQPKERARETA